MAWLKCTMLETRFDWCISVYTLNKKIYSCPLWLIIRVVRKGGCPQRKKKKNASLWRSQYEGKSRLATKNFITRPRQPSCPMETNINTLFNQNDMTYHNALSHLKPNQPTSWKINTSQRVWNSKFGFKKNLLTVSHGSNFQD